MSASEQDVRNSISAVQQGNGEDNPWPTRLGAWKNFSEKFHDRGSKIEARYEDERDANNMTVGLGMNDAGGKRVNMFYSNTTVIKESLFNSLPKPSVNRLHFGEWDNDVARVAALIVQRGLNYQVQTAPHFEMAVKNAILDRLVPGLGTVWIEFVPGKPAIVDAQGITTKQATPGHLAILPVYWKELLWDPARTWEESTWVGRILHPSVKDAKARWGENAISEPNKVGQSAMGVEEAMRAGKVCIYQIWDKDTRTVIHMTPEGNVLSTDHDPYQLSNFFPTPKPLIASPPTRKFLPLPDYYMAQDQYLMMDVLYARINLIIEAVKVAGVYDASQPSIGRMLGGTENKLIPVDNWAMFAERGGLKGTIDWFPIAEIVTALRELTNAYAFIKSQLYEVTGMSDITRGSSNQYETAAAQQIKAQFASVRLNGYQRDTAKFVSETLNIMAELMVQLYGKEELSKVCGQLPVSDQEFVDPALALLQNDFLTQCSIKIESDSLTQADWGLEQQQRMAYVQALSQFIQSALPVAQQSPAVAPLLAEIARFATVGFKGSSELEGALDNTLKTLQEAAKQPPKPDPAQIKAEQEGKKMQQEMALKEQEGQQKLAEGNQKIELQRQQMVLDREEHEQEMAFRAAEHQQKMDFMRAEAELKATVDLGKAAIDVGTKTAAAEIDLANAKKEQKEEENE